MRKKMIIAAMAALVSVLHGVSVWASDMALVRDGAPASVIIVANDAPEMVHFAAREFQAYMKKISGAEIPITNTTPVSDVIRIFIGESDYTRELGLMLDGLGYDGFKIKTGPDWLALIGRESKPAYGISHPLRARESYHPGLKISRFGESGALYAVYRFLEEYCGVRWYMPGDLGEVVPPQKNIAISAIDRQETPDFEYRNLYYGDFPGHDDDVLWFRRVGFGGPAVSINHSFRRLGAKYRESNPEFFALHRGARDFDVTCMGRGNLCLSEPGLQKAVVADIRAYFDENPEQLLFPLMPNDGFRYPCECEKCAEYVEQQFETAQDHPQAISNYIWDFVNRVAGEVYKTHPDKLIGCCAYSLFINPPTNIEKLSPNVAVMICKTRRNYWNKDSKDKMNDFIAQWSRKARQIYIWEYYLWAGREPLLRGMPVFFPGIISEDMRMLKDISRGEFVEGGTWRYRSDDDRKMALPGLIHINYYITGKLYWNADADVYALLDEYYEKFYGPAHAEMKDFWSFAEELWMARSPDDGVNLYDSVYREENIERLMACLDAAIAKTDANTPERARVELIRSEFLPVRERVQRVRVVTPPVVTVPYIAPQPGFTAGAPAEEFRRTAAKTDFVDTTGGQAEYKTDMFLAWDDKNLYLAFVNDEPNPAGMLARALERDQTRPSAVYQDESIEIFINPDPVSDKVYYQLVANTIGTLWDNRYVKGARNAPEEWQSGMAAEASIEEGRWILKVKIPFKDIGVEQADGRTFKANFYRNRLNEDREGVTGSSAWAPPLGNRYHEQSRFGTLRFEKQPGTTSQVDVSAGKTDFDIAYLAYIQARAGDHGVNDSDVPAYSDVAKQFQRAAATADAPARRAESFYHAALCFFLDLEVSAAYNESRKVVEQVRVGSLLPEAEIADIEQTLARINNGDADAAARVMREYWERHAPAVDVAVNNDSDTGNSDCILMAEKLTAILQRETKTLALKKKVAAYDLKTREFKAAPEKEDVASIFIIAALHPRFAVSGAENMEKVNQALCASNLRQIGVALYLYAQDNGRFPNAHLGKGRGAWHQVVIPYTDGSGVSWSKRSDVWRCPSVAENAFSYGVNNMVNHVYDGDPQNIPDRAKMLLVADSVYYKPGSYPHAPDYGGGAYSIRGRVEHSGGTVDRKRHGGGANILYADGRVEWLPHSKIPVVEGVFWRGQP